jgi:hypothetical protein
MRPGVGAHVEVASPGTGRQKVSRYGAQSPAWTHAGAHDAPASLATQRFAWLALFWPQSESPAHGAVHHPNAPHTPGAPASTPTQGAHAELVAAHGSPMAPVAGAQTFTVPRGWQVVPASCTQSEFAPHVVKHRNAPPCVSTQAFAACRLLTPQLESAADAHATVHHEPLQSPETQSASAEHGSPMKEGVLAPPASEPRATQTPPSAAPSPTTQTATWLPAYAAQSASALQAGAQVPASAYDAPAHPLGTPALLVPQVAPVVHGAVHQPPCPQ